MADMRTDHLPTSQLVSQLSEQVSTLVRDELTLARMEMVEKGRRAGLGAGLLGGAGVIALYGVGALLVTIGALLAFVLPVWAAALLVTVVLVVVAGIAALLGKKQVTQATRRATTAGTTPGSAGGSPLPYAAR